MRQTADTIAYSATGEAPEKDSKNRKTYPMQKYVKPEPDTTSVGGKKRDGREAGSGRREGSVYWYDTYYEDHPITDAIEKGNITLKTTHAVTDRIPLVHSDRRLFSNYFNISSRVSFLLFSFSSLSFITTALLVT